MRIKTVCPLWNYIFFTQILAIKFNNLKCQTCLMGVMLFGTLPLVVFLLSSQPAPPQQQLLVLSHVVWR